MGAATLAVAAVDNGRESRSTPASPAQRTSCTTPPLSMVVERGNECASYDVGER